MGFLDRFFGKKTKAGAHTSFDGRQMTSLVVLSKSRANLTLDSLRETLDSIWPGEFLPPKDSGNFVVAGPVKGAMFMVVCNIPGYAGGFMIHSVPASYDGYSDFKQCIKDAELIQIVNTHRSWLSVDRIMPQGTEEEHYRFIGVLLSRIAPEDSVAVVHPTKLLTIRFTEEVRTSLSLDGHAQFN